MVETVVKLGGGVLAHLPALDRALDLIAKCARARRLVVVPGGGPFADAVRHADTRVGLCDTAAHWMATLAMDQYAHLLASRLAGSTLVTRACEIDAALEAGRVPVLAPSRWLQEADPLPHSWDVTSDTIAGWFAGELGATAVVLVKPPGVQPDGAGHDLVDAYFRRVLPAQVRSVVIAADDIAALESALRPPV